MGNAEERDPQSIDVLVLSAAEDDIRGAFSYYEDIVEGLGFDFIESLNFAIESVMTNPLAFPTIYK